MPMYSYICETCDTGKVLIRKIAERDNQNCDDCGTHLQRQIDRPGGVYAPTSTGGGLKV